MGSRNLYVFMFSNLSHGAAARAARHGAQSVRAQAAAAAGSGDLMRPIHLQVGPPVGGLYL